MTFRPTLTALLLALCSLPVVAQERLPQPWASQRASVTQRVGMTDVSVTYYRPGVKGRQLWGGVVPYGRVWRCGANENTVVSFTHDVRVEGDDLAAGSYGLHMIPGEERWVVIFSTNTTSWGSYFYDRAEDALRVEVEPVAAPHEEWLEFDFDDLERDAATLSLRWGELAVPIRLAVDTDEIVLDIARDEYLRGLPAFSWQGWNNAAEYCLRNGVNLEEGLAWAERSVQRGANFTNVSTMAALLEELGRLDEAEAARDQALAVATEAELNGLGYRSLQRDDIDRALMLFERNVENHPTSWNVYDSLGQAYATAGRVDDAIAAYTRALELVDRTGDAMEAERIRSILSELER